jgi:hypothetical protein
VLKSLSFFSDGLDLRINYCVSPLKFSEIVPKPQENIIDIKQGGTLYIYTFADTGSSVPCQNRAVAVRPGCFPLSPFCNDRVRRGTGYGRAGFHRDRGCLCWGKTSAMTEDIGPPEERAFLMPVYRDEHLCETEPSETPLKHDGCVKNPDAAFKLHPSSLQLVPGTRSDPFGLPEHVPYASLVRVCAPCRSLPRRKPGELFTKPPQIQGFGDFLRVRQA